MYCKHNVWRDITIAERAAALKKLHFANLANGVFSWHQLAAIVCLRSSGEAGDSLLKQISFLLNKVGKITIEDPITSRIFHS